MLLAKVLKLENNKVLKYLFYLISEIRTIYLLKNSAAIKEIIKEACY